ncbi:MAG: DUF2442 domain-containing protein [Cyclobacteriaceae bacterium]
MNISKNNFDTLEQVIFEKGLRIVSVYFQMELDLMLVVLNNKKVLERPISSSNRLKGASSESLNNYRLISDGLGIHWPDLDEDLSLKGFLQEEITKVGSFA